MEELEKFVVSFNLARKLKAAHFPENTFVYWREPGLLIESDIRGKDDEYFAAPTAQEVADQLEPTLMINKKPQGGYMALATEPFVKAGDGDTMAEALALLWLKRQEAFVRHQ